MISLKDLLQLEKLATKVTYPLLGIALYVTFMHPHLISLTNNNAVLIIIFLVFVPLSALIAFGLHVFISDVDLDKFNGKLFPLLGISLISFGCLVLSKLFGEKPIIEVNYYWYLWAFSYGVTILELCKESNSQCHQKRRTL